MRRSVILFVLLGCIFGCVKEDYFGLSPHGNIKQFLVSHQAGNAVIDTEAMRVTVEIPAGVDLTDVLIESLQVSSFANANVQVGDKLDLSELALIVVTSEDGNDHLWEIEAFVASETPQLSNGNLNLWYRTNSDYYEPGERADNTIWGTGNQGTQILNKLATTPEDLGGDNLAGRLETIYLGPLSAAFGAPIAAGSLYTGVFNPDNLAPTDPEAAIEFGTPFTGRPEKLRFAYSYVPGEENEDSNGNPIDYSDACDIYAYLEIRLGGKTERLATAWFRSDITQSDLTTAEVEFVYGALDNSYPDYMHYEGDYVSADSAVFVLPTHITFVASSSFDGANFAGAIGSLLIIDDVEMVY